MIVLYRSSFFVDVVLLTVMRNDPAGTATKPRPTNRMTVVKNRPPVVMGYISP